jgi:hypothetical protein
MARREEVTQDDLTVPRANGNSRGRQVWARRRVNVIGRVWSLTGWDWKQSAVHYTVCDGFSHSGPAFTALLWSDVPTRLDRKFPSSRQLC